jgi:ankyrin repeat protein
MSQEVKESSVLSSSSSTTTTHPQDNKAVAVSPLQPLSLGDAKVAALLRPIKTNISIKPRFRDTAFAEEIFAEPYSCDTGDIYEWEQITHWLKTHDTNPKTNERLESKKLRPAKDKQEHVQEFLDENPELRDSEELYMPRHWVKELEQACQKGDIATIKRLAERDKRLLRWTFNFDKAEGLVDHADYERWQGKNMLHLACQSGTREALVQLVTLIEKQTLGLALHLLLQTDSQGRLPLHYAIAREQETAIIPFLKCGLGAPLSYDITFEQSTAIFSTVMTWMKNQWHNLTLPPTLLEKADAQGHTPLHRAILAGSLDIVKWLLTQKASLVHQNHAGQTALHLAAIKDHVEILQLLLAQGAVLNAQDQEGHTALHLAAVCGCQTTLAALLRAGSSPTTKNKIGQTALHLAATDDHVETLQLLLAQGAALNTQDQEGNTALHLAAMVGRQTTLAALLRAGSSPTIKNNAGKTARESAHDAETTACYDLVTTQLREKEAEALKAHGPLGVMLLQQQELIRQQQAELAQQKTEIAALRERLKTLEVRLVPGVPASYPQKEKAAHSSSGFGLFDEKKQAPIPAAQLPMGDAKPLEQLLKFVAEGEQDQAEALIKKDSKLLLAAGKVTDLSGRTFDNITAFQYALWAMDYHMWTMIQKYLPKEAQAEQHAALESKGTAHGKHFDLQPLLEALKTYVDNFDSWNWHQREEQWCKKVGGAQKLLPAHVVNEYCRRDRPFDPCPAEWASPLPRTRAVEVFINFNWVEGSWFTPPTPSESLGVSFALRRAGKQCGRGVVYGAPADVGARSGRRDELKCVRADLKTLQALWTARTQQLNSLADTLGVESQSTLQVGLK